MLILHKKLDCTFISQVILVKRIDPFHDDVARLWGGIKPRLLMFQLESYFGKENSISFLLFQISIVLFASLLAVPV